MARRYSRALRCRTLPFYERRNELGLCYDRSDPQWHLSLPIRRYDDVRGGRDRHLPFDRQRNHVGSRETGLRKHRALELCKSRTQPLRRHMGERSILLARYWIHLASREFRLETGVINTIVVNSTDVFIGTRDGLFRSTDNGATWGQADSARFIPGLLFCWRTPYVVRDSFLPPIQLLSGILCPIEERSFACPLPLEPLL